MPRIRRAHATDNEPVRPGRLPIFSATREARPGHDPEYLSVLHRLKKHLGHADGGSLVRSLIWKEAERLGIATPPAIALPPNVVRLFGKKG
jgi:hypothetical protein